MFKSSIRLFKIFGIEIRLDYSWFIIFALFVYYFGFFYFPDLLPDINQGLLIIITIITVLLFFFSILFHEMSHSLVAKKRGIPVERISLFIFGGMAQIKKEPDNPYSEFVMAIAGPVASFFLAIIFGTIWVFTRFVSIIGEPVKYLALINVILGVFNLLPGYPLDGGRIARAIIWKVTGNFKRATFIASNIGRVIGFLIIGTGIYFIFTGNFLNGIWLAFIGWFLQTQASIGYKQLIFETSIKGIKVKDIMNRDIVSISKDLTLDNLVNNYFMKYRYGRFPVVKDIDVEEIIGVISIHDIKTVPRDQWSTTKVGDIVKSVSKKEIINMDMEVADAIRKMSSNNLGHLVVMTGNKLIGLITKSDVMKFIKIRSELH